MKYVPLPRVIFSFCRAYLAPCLLLGLLACGGDSEDGDDPNPNCGMRATVNGNAWCGTSDFLVSFGPPGGNPVTITGNDNNTAIVMEIASTNPGTYPLSRGEAEYSDRNFVTFASISGAVVVTSSTNDQLVGTFSFEALNPLTNGRVVVANGQFTARR
jgi:hypothetical protein